MARLTRFFQKVFASSAANNGVFGSGQDGTKILSNDLATLQSKPAFLTGWVAATLGASKFPPLEEMQALDYITTSQIAYLFQEGIAEWDASTTYYANSLVKAAGGTKIYISLTNANLNNAVTSLTNWKFVLDLADVRRRLTANETFYVATTGSNITGNGLVGTPWQTIQFAYDYIAKNIDAAGYAVTIQCAAGTYTAGLSAAIPIMGASSVTVLGDNATPTNCLISVTSGNCFASSLNAKYNINGFKLQTTTSGNCIDTNFEGLIDFTAINFGACAGAHISCYNNSLIRCLGNYSITAGAVYHVTCHDNSSVLYNPVTITLTGTPAFSSATAEADGIGFVGIGGVTFSGAATGKRYDSKANSVISTTGGGANFIPGNVAGTTATGGQYV